MPPSAPLDVVPLWALMVALFVANLLFDEWGFRIGRLMRRTPAKESDSTVGTIVAAELGLLGFLLAFTFGIVAARFDLRRQMVLNEAIAIGTAFLRAQMLPEPQSGSIRGLLRSYTVVRLGATSGLPIDDVLRRSDDIHQQLWVEAVAAAAHDPRSVQTGLFVESLNEVIDLHAARLMAAVRSRMPLPVRIVLFAIEVLAFFTIGYQAGLTTATRSPVAIVLAVALCAVIWLVADLDRPGEGFLRVGQEPMIEVQTMMKGEPSSPRSPW
jgi:hypothetical protein